LLIRGLNNSARHAYARHVRDQPQPRVARKCREGRHNRYVVSDVTDEPDSLSARRHDGVNGRLYPTRIEIEHPDRVSVATKAPGRRAADARAGSRYEGSQLVSISSGQ
jgi:hypothetical protein